MKTNPMNLKEGITMKNSNPKIGNDDEKQKSQDSDSYEKGKT